MPTQARDSRGRFARGNGRPTFNEQEFAAMVAMVANATFSRAQLAADSMDPRRNVNHECGFPETEDLTPDLYRKMYDREAVAARVVEVLPQESWMVQPTVYETENPKQVTAFEKAWGELGRNLRGQSWYQDEQGNPIWEHLHRIDKLSGIGRFGILLLGLDDGKDLADPAEGIDEAGQKTGNGGDRKLLYLRSFDESLVSIAKSETDTSNPRYGWPTEYSVKLGSEGSTKVVHWSRVIHVADNLGSSEVLATPRQQPVWNNLYNLRKIYHGDAEAFWYNVVGDLFFEAAPSGARVPEDALRQMMERMKSGLQRWGAIGELTAKRLAPTMMDPTPHVDMQITAICIQIDIPKRIFMGSERGELSSAQDKSRWNGRLSGRHNNNLTPRLVVPFIDRNIMLGTLPEPAGYSVVWPDLNALTEEEQATIALKRTEAFVKYVEGGVDSLILPLDYLTRVHGMTIDEAEAMLKAVMEEVGSDESDEDEDEYDET